MTKQTKDSSWDEMDRAFKTVVSVTKHALLKEEAKQKKARAKRKLNKKPS